MNRSLLRPGRPARRGRRQRGGFLLEALVGILIFTLGVIALLTLQARAISYTSDANYRGEAAYLANDLISRMWAENRTALASRYTAVGQTGYDAFKAAVDATLPGASAIANNPSVEIVQPAAGAVLPDARGDGSGITLTSTGTLVTITIQWTPPAQEGTTPVDHRFQISTILAHNS